VAKKKKGARKTASRGTRKTTPTRRTRKPAPRRAAAVSEWAGTGLEDPKRVSFIPLKKIITEQIRRLEPAKGRPEVDKALEVLKSTKAQLSSACATTKTSMVIEF
jgi:hypothetical protein